MKTCDFATCTRLATHRGGDWHFCEAHHRLHRRITNEDQAACGTRAGYRRHLYSNESPCQACWDVEKTYQAKRREKVDGRLVLGDVMRVVNITYRQLDYWARTDLVTPSVPARGSGSVREYSRDDLIKLLAVKALVDLGMALGCIRQHLPSLLRGEPYEVKIGGAVAATVTIDPQHLGQIIDDRIANLDTRHLRSTG